MQDLREGAEKHKIQMGMKRRNDIALRRLTTIVHHYDFEAVPGIVEPSQGLEAGRQQLWPPICRDNNSEKGQVHSFMPSKRL